MWKSVEFHTGKDRDRYPPAQCGGVGGGVGGGSTGGRERGVVGRNTEGDDDEPGNTWSVSSISSVSKFSKNIQQTIERKFK